MRLDTFVLVASCMGAAGCGACSTEVQIQPSPDGGNPGSDAGNTAADSGRSDAGSGPAGQITFVNSGYLLCESVAPNWRCSGLDDNGQVWGINYYAQNPTMPWTQRINNFAKTSPVDAPELAGFDTLVVAPNAFNLCGLKGGAAYCWGKNDQGQCGNGTTTDVPMPTLVQGLTGLPVSLAVDDHSACAVMADGTLHCWGQIQRDAALTNALTATAIPEGTGVKNVSVALGVTCFLKTDGTVWCWGNNGLGGLGNASQDPATAGTHWVYTAVQAGLSGPATELAGSCTVVAGGVECWGYNIVGIANPTAPGGIVAVPRVVIPHGSGASRLINSESLVACVLENGAPLCWGSLRNIPLFRTLGDGGYDLPPSAPPSVPTPVESIVYSPGSGDFCYRTPGESAFQCIGPDLAGEFGNGSLGTSSLPAPISFF
jgi:hypothetical protein